ncbi:MAG: hypothetical protein LBP59_05580 [Planctomycetaceae bacterium]|nr:hypothetical protein [Planctomycetaceae bacterium]
MRFKYNKRFVLYCVYLRLPNYRTTNFDAFKLFALEFSFTVACLVFGRQALTLLNR